MSEQPTQSPEGALIADALKRSRLSARKAAARAGISEGRWRQIVSGYQIVSAGVHAPVRGPAETVARMAEVVGLTPQQLEAAGREDAAAELRDLIARHGGPMDRAEAMLDENERLIAEILALPPREQQTARAAVRAVVAALKESAETDGPDGNTRR